MTGQLPEVADTLDAQPARDFVVDGELVAFQDGLTSFSRLQRRGRERVSVFLYVFDLLRLEGRDVRDLPLRERKALLCDSLGFGFDHVTLEELGGRLRELERDDSPFADAHPIPRGTHWVEPELVAQIGFSEWTQGGERASPRSPGRLRHPRYLGLRDDKPAGEVVRERPS